jgi:hypothetical protein
MIGGEWVRRSGIAGQSTVDNLKGNQGFGKHAL